MSASLHALQPDLQPFARELVDAASRAGLSPRVTSTRRSHAEQERLYRRSLAGQQAYPVARPGTSPHEYGWAFDMVVSPMSYLPEVGRYWEELGGVWGARAGAGYDPVHFEYPGWRSFVNWNEPDPRGVIARRHDPSKYADAADYAMQYFPGLGFVSLFFDILGYGGRQPTLQVDPRTGLPVAR